MSTKTTKREPGAVEALRQEVCALAASADADAGAIKEAVERLLAGAGPNDVGRGEFELKAVKVCLERRNELPSAYPENPLDDHEKLEEVRRLVFGLPPWEKES